MLILKKTIAKIIDEEIASLWPFVENAPEYTDVIARQEGAIAELLRLKLRLDLPITVKDLNVGIKCLDSKFYEKDPVTR